MSAVLSECGTYRYELHRDLGSLLRWYRPILWVMLNPSTADAEKDDPTIRRCINFSTLWGHTHLMVGNLYAYRATDPKALRTPTMGVDIVGPKNDEHLLAMATKAERIMLAWGQRGPQKERVDEVVELFWRFSSKMCVLGWTKGNEPRHPLMFPKDSQPESWAQP